MATPYTTPYDIVLDRLSQIEPGETDQIEVGGIRSDIIDQIDNPITDDDRDRVWDRYSHHGICRMIRKGCSELGLDYETNGSRGDDLTFLIFGPEA